MPGPTFSGRSLAWAVPILAEAAALCRSIAFAWIIGPEELGRAMMLALTVRLIEMTSDVGIERLIVQARYGNSARLQSGLHGIAVLRGLLSGLAILALSPALAMVFHDGPGALSYAALAAVPAIRGFVHLDFRRVERHFAYARMAIVEGGATLGMLAAILPSVWLLGDHRAMSAVLIAHAATYVVLSRLVANRRYRLRPCVVTLRRSWSFGAPLMLNALMLFLTFYADRLIVAKTYDWSQLALYGVAIQLALLPAQIVGRAAASLVLPVLRDAVQRDTLGAVWPRILSVHALLACSMVAGFVLVAPPLIAAVYGPGFRPDAALALALAVAAGFRILRTPFSQLAVAVGRTGDPARSNLVRALALIPAAAFAAAGLPLAWVAGAAAVGEAGATLRAFRLSNLSPKRRTIKEAYA